MVLLGQDRPILTNIQDTFLVAFAITVVSTAAGFWMAGMGSAEKKSKSSKTTNDV
jgi:hypothetical protein